ncbi:hypothetical protein DPMN_171561 [Dreissena polymorpha]|uniref:Uncharacterized protein n=1 Tax=Dreissena polymorpha TaxID=45954 RepID=A0A9D4DY84_DREPO|nr:hypothetical protein DPMN_171561 [Dreissena polymorpha]
MSIVDLGYDHGQENHEESLSQMLVLLSQLDKLRIEMRYDTPDLWKTLHGLNIKSLSLRIRGVNHAELLSQSLASLKQLEMLSIEVNTGNRPLWEVLHGLGIKSLSLIGDWHDVFSSGLKVFNETSLKQSMLKQLKQLETLDVWVYKDDPGLWEALQGLSIKSLSLSGYIYGYIYGFKPKYATSLKQSILSLKQLETLYVCVEEDTPDLWEALQGLSIKSLSLDCLNTNCKLKYATSLKQSLVSLKQLDTLYVSMYDTLNVSTHEDNPGLWEALQGLSIKSLSLTLSQDSPVVNSSFRLKYATSLKQSILSLKELETLSISVEYNIHGLWEALHSLSIKSLRLQGTEGGFETKYAESLKQWLSSLTKLDTLSISVDKTNPDLWEALHGLSIKSLSMSLGSKYIDFNLNYAESIKKSLLSLTELDTLSIIAKKDSPGLCETLNCLNIKRLSLSGEKRGLRVDHAESLSQSLSSLTQLETLTLHLNTYIALQVPRSLKYLNIYSKKLLPSELRDLVGRLAARPHAIDIELEIGCASSIDPPERILLQEYILVQQELVSRPNVVVKKFRTYESESNSTMPVHYIGGVDNPAHCDLSIEDYAYDIFAELMERFKYSRISIGLQINPDSFL